MRTLLIATLLVCAPTTEKPAFAQDETVCAFARPATAGCLNRYGRETVGLPRYRATEASEDASLVCRDGYALSFNCATGNPDWVVERLNRTILTGGGQRLDNFAPDPDLPGGPQLSDYKGSGFDRGHQAPAADFKLRQQLTDESFYLTNMSPQVGIGFNRGIWAKLESEVRAWVLCGPHPNLIVMTGPIFGENPRPIKSGSSVLKPIAYFKIVFDTRSQRALAFRLDNRKAAKGEKLADKIVSIDEIEDETGLDFFSGLTARKQRVLESSKGASWGFDHRCVGAVED